MSDALDRIVGRVPLTVWVAVVAGAASWGGTYALMSSQIQANAAGLEELRGAQAVTNARIDGRIRAAEDDNRDQKADISRIDAVQRDVSATLRVFQDDTRNRFEALMLTTAGVKTTLDNMAAASGVRLPNDPPTPLAPTRPGR